MINNQDPWWYNDESKAVLNRGYLLNGETIHDAIERITSSVIHHLSTFGNQELKDKFKEAIYKGWISLSSPIWSNCGTSRGLPISCMGCTIDDSVESIVSKHAETAMHTKRGSGTSAYFGNLRGRGAAITNNGESSGAVSFMKMWDTMMNVVSQGSCYVEGTEVLTDKGFKDFRNVDPTIDSIAQVDKYGNITFINSYELTKKSYNGEVIGIQGKKRKDLVDIVVTPNHRMVIEKLSRSNGLKHWKGFTEIVIAENLKLHRDNRLHVSGYSTVNSEPLSWKEKLFIAFQADGVKNNKGNTLQFNFRKDRKVKRLEEICIKLVLKYKIIKTSNGDIRFTIYEGKPYKYKDFSWVRINEKSKLWCEEFIKELQYWDGCKQNNSINYSTINKINVDVIQAIASICGKRTRIRVLNNRPGNRQTLYNINISNNNKIQGDSCSIYKKAYNGMVYCCIVPEGRIVVRYNNRVLINGNTRRGSFAAYLDIDHPDINEFLRIKNIGDDIQSIFPAVCVPDYWMKEMIEGDLEKRKIWAKVLENRQQIGLPYIFFTDNVNKNKPEIYKFTDSYISHSNLCQEIALPDTVDETFICCLCSLNLALYDEWKDTDLPKIATYFLDGIMSEYIAKTENDEYLQPARRFSIRHRAIGIGIMGWHSYLQSKMIPFESLEANLLTTKIFKDLEKQTKTASQQLGEILGYAPIFLENPNFKGLKYRNTTTMAIAPTTSSSSILGQVSPGIEPYMSNYYKAGLAKGNFIRKNKYLKEILKNYDKDDDETWRSIMMNKGSVQHLDFLSDLEKKVFKTFREISQHDIITQAAIRQKYIDQGQSLNINIPPEIPIKEVNKLIIYAWEQGIKGLYYQRSSSVSKDMLTNLISCTSCES